MSTRGYKMGEIGIHGEWVVVTLRSNLLAHIHAQTFTHSQWEYHSMNSNNDVCSTRYTQDPLVLHVCMYVCTYMWTSECYAFQSGNKIQWETVVEDWLLFFVAWILNSGIIFPLCNIYTKRERGKNRLGDSRAFLLRNSMYLFYDDETMILESREYSWKRAVVLCCCCFRKNVLK